MSPLLGALVLLVGHASARPPVEPRQPPEPRADAAAAEQVLPRPGRVGSLLPLSGRYEAVGTQLRDALDAGWGAAGGPHPLVHADTLGTPEGAVAALERLVTQEQVGAVLGPLLTPETAPVIEAAERLGVPLVLLSQGVEDVAVHRWTLQGWVTPGQQIDALLAHAFDHAGWTRFAVVAPDSDYGRHAATRFAEGVRARGGTVSVEVSYPADATGLAPVAAKVSRRPKADAPPLVDYQAVFLPDRARQVPLVAAALAVDDVPLGAYKPFEDGPVPLMGLSGWNSWDIIAGGGSYVVGARFTDVFLPPPSNELSWTPRPAWKEFVDVYKERTGRTASPAEALAYDAAALVGVAARTKPETRTAFLEALLAAERAPSVTGASGFDRSTRALRHRIEVISVTRGGMAPVGDP